LRPGRIAAENAQPLSQDPTVHHARAGRTPSRYDGCVEGSRIVVNSRGLHALVLVASALGSEGCVGDPGAPYTGQSTPPTCNLPMGRALVATSDAVQGVIPAGPGRATLTCAATGPSNERAHPLHLETRAAVYIHARCASTGCAVAVRRDCDDAATEVACNGTPMQYGPPLAGFVRTVLEPGDYHVVIDTDRAHFVDVEYDLHLRAFDPQPNYACSSPIPIADGQTLTNQRVARAGEPDMTCGGDQSQSADSDTIGETLYYVTQVPAGHTMVVTPRATVGFDSLRVLLRGDCARATCLVQSPREPGYEYANTTGATQSVVFGVAPVAPGSYLDVVFDVSVRARAETGLAR
jgi:hypothetical protein